MKPHFVLPLLAASLFVTPASAMADTITVTTHSAGYVNPNPVVLSTLGLGNPGSGPVTFDLTVSSTFDPTMTGYRDMGNEVYAGGSRYTIDLRIGSQTYAYAGNSWADVRVDNDGPNGEQYQQEIGLYPPQSSTRSIEVSQWVTGPAALIGLAQPLVPRDIGGDPNLVGYMDISAYTLNPDAPDPIHMTANATSFSLSIVSSVPEPSSAVLLGAGLFGLSWWTRRRKKPGLRPVP